MQLVRCIQLLRVRCMLHLLRCIQLLQRIIAKADVLIQNLAPGAGTTHSRTQTQTRTRTHAHAHTRTRSSVHTASILPRYTPDSPPTHPPYPTLCSGACGLLLRGAAPRAPAARHDGHHRVSNHPPNAHSARRRLRYGATPKACVGCAVCASQAESLCFRPPRSTPVCEYAEYPGR